MAKHSTFSKDTSFRGPIVASPDSMAGLVDGYPIELISNMDYQIHVNDFDKEADFDTTNDWTVTNYTGSTTGLRSTANSLGVFSIDPSGANQGAVVQRDSGSIQGGSAVGAHMNDYTLIPGFLELQAKDAFFMCRFRHLDVGSCSFFVGLAELNATSSVLSGGATPTTASTVTSDNHIGFYLNTSHADVVQYTVAGDDDTTAVSGPAFNIVDNSYVDVAMRTFGASQYWLGYRSRGRNTRSWREIVSGTLSTPFTTDVQIVPTFANSGAGASDRLDVDMFGFCRYRDYYTSEEVVL